MSGKGPIKSNEPDEHEMIAEIKEWFNELVGTDPAREGCLTLSLKRSFGCLMNGDQVRNNG